jgi:hypothetical protein
MKMIPWPSITVVPLHLVIRNSEFRAVGDNSLAVADDGHIVFILEFEAVRLEGVGFSAARHPGNFVGLREVLVPLPDFSGLVFPLAVVARERRDTNNPDRWSTGLRLYSPPFAHIECTDAVKCGPLVPNTDSVGRLAATLIFG